MSASQGPLSQFFSVFSWAPQENTSLDLFACIIYETYNAKCLKFVSQMNKNENTTPEFFDLSDSNRLCQSVINLLKELEQ